MDILQALKYLLAISDFTTYKFGSREYPFANSSNFRFAESENMGQALKFL